MEKIICLGFGNHLIDIAQFCKKNSLGFDWYSSKRQYYNNNQYEIKTRKNLKKLKINPKIVNNINNLTDLKNNILVLSIGSPFIIKEKFLKKFSNKVINYHASPLPQFRGGGEFSWRILSNDRNGAITFHLIDKSIDTGPIIFQKKFIYPNTLRYPIDYKDFTYIKYKDSINLILEKIINGKSFKLIYKKPNLTSYFPRLNTNLQGYINWNWEGKEIERFILAFSYPYDGASTFVEKRLTRIYDCSFFKLKKFQHSFNYGLVFKYIKNYFYVICKGGYLKIKNSNLKTPKKIIIGDKLYTPQKKIDDANEIRIRYNDKGLFLKKN